MLSIYSAPQKTVSADMLYNNALHRKELGGKATACIGLCWFVFFKIRRGTFTNSGGDDADATKRNTNRS